MNIGKLIVVRHHESEWNKLGKWTGSTDIALTQHGCDMSSEMGALVRDIHIDHAFDSTQKRSSQTLMCMLEAMKQSNVPVTNSAALNERDYGDYTGKDKWGVKSLIGENDFNLIRRGWNIPVPNGETLKMVYERTVPYYLEIIVPVLKEGKNVLISAHGNSLRALRKYIEQISDEGIQGVEMPFGAVIIYDIDEKGHMTHWEERDLISEVTA